jgi:hypothetical protein
LLFFDTLFIELCEGLGVIRWELSKGWRKHTDFIVNRKLNWVRAMRSMDHATGNSLLLLEVVLLLTGLGDPGHQLEIHEAALGVGVGLGGHQSHCLLVIIIIGAFSVRRALLDHCLVSLKTLVALNILVVWLVVVL